MQLVSRNKNAGGKENCFLCIVKRNKLSEGTGTMRGMNNFFPVWVPLATIASITCFLADLTIDRVPLQ